MNRRKTDVERGWRRLIRENAYRDLWLLIITGLTVWAIIGIAAQARTQRDGQCQVFERLEVAAVKRVQTQYDYLEQLPSTERGSNLTKAILRGLESAYEDAVASKAPAYCGEKGVGLPEAPPYDPALPEHQDFSHLAEKP